MSATVLYTPQVLGLAVELAGVPLDDTLPHTGDARSKSCGSTLSLGLALDEDGRIERIGIRCQACAIGQAAAALFARGAIGLTAAQVHSARDAVAAWLAGGGPLPEWADLEIIAAAREYPARHGAVMLPWMAACSALPSVPA